VDILKGYIKTRGKKPIETYRKKKKFYTYDYIRKTGGDFAGILADGMVQIDVDDEEEADLVKNIVTDQKISCAILKTTRGLHFYFRNKDLNKRQTKKKTPIGVSVDIGIGEQNALVPIKVEGKTRRWLNRIENIEDIDFLPDWLRPIKNAPDFSALGEGDGRNQTLFNYILTLQSEGFSKESIKNTIAIINQYILKVPLEKRELDKILRDEAFLKESFYIKSKFLHDKFAKFLKAEEHIIKINSQLHIYRDGIYKSDPLEIESSMIKHLPELTKSKRNEIYSYLQLIAEDVEPSDAKYIALASGVLDINTMTITDFSPDLILQNKIKYNYLPSAYDSVVDRTLDKICCNDKDLRKLLEELVGYLLFRRNEMGKCFILTGSGSNGKSTFLDMTKNLLGSDNYSSLGIDELGERFKTAELFHKLANIGDDISKKYIDDNAIFKKLVTGETVNVERKGKDPFEFNNYAKLLFSANKLPRINDTSDGLMRRLVIIPFNAVFSEKDADFDAFIKDKLLTKSAMEYLLKLGIEGLKRVLTTGFTEPSVVTKEKKEYEMINNPVLTFINEGIKIENEPSKDVYRKYSTWCYENGLKPLSHVEFGREINKHGFESKVKRVNGKTIRIYIKDITEVTDK
jgi:putative DNA primase/helicase